MDNIFSVRGQVIGSMILTHVYAQICEPLNLPQKIEYRNNNDFKNILSSTTLFNLAAATNKAQTLYMIIYKEHSYHLTS